MVELHVVRGDITRFPADAIVNAANSSLLGGGGVDGAIHRAGGPEILADCRRLRASTLPHGLPAGDAVATGAGDLPARWVIHTVGPVYLETEDRSPVLRSAYTRSLAVADELGARTVAFPLISAGVYGWPRADAVHQAVTAVRQARTAVQDVTFVAFSDEVADLLRDELRSGGSAVLVTAEELAAQIDSGGASSGRPPVLLDVRWALGDRHGRRHFETAHLPGAVFVDLETELAAPASAGRGRHPLPDVADLQAAARRWGISAGDPVVVYDDTGNTAAARAWWLLRWAGVADVRLLDGGLAAWTGAGFPVESGPGAPPAAGDVTLSAGHLPTVDIGQAATWSASGVLLDARAGERYRGEAEPVDPRAGHIPGAVSAPTSENLDGSGRFADEEELRRRFADLGVDASTPTAVYCGSGVTAAHQVAALALAGIEAALYPGSWSQWSADPARPSATGPTPAGDSDS
ncbi:3-mercaptopyruvate sulfurtransferase SseA, contains two rhodanese domains [Rhodococcus tukisamuensis]|uniref:3-mercaptopyruvate sulfurtransferase SseA, contains two rhodanese domains n=1 Tax=Rhodococcus tukisamuensis TaxID=168276 RepID=A0A1G7D6R1_9NOCA|nr:3-mercaptopyruvate sulfurtransferase SseA, contains two rhodanese domains [Rhodococcus tukisamuensis]